MQKSNGFTLIELLVVIVVIGILSGITLTVLNPTTFRNKAENAVRLKEIGGTAQAIEAYAAAEGIYPSAWNDPVLETYLKDFPLMWITYLRNADRSEFLIYRVSVDDNNKYYKYDSTWGEIRECKNAGVANIGICTT